MSIDLKNISNKWWNFICKKVNDSVVFIDSPAAECLHWCGGINRLLTAGTREVKEFSSFESGSDDHKKGVFILTQPIVGIAEATLTDIIRNSNFEHCIVLTNVHPKIQQIANDSNMSGNENDTIQELKDRILRCMGRVTYRVEIECHPIFVASLCPLLFISPPFNHLFPKLPTDIEPIPLPRKIKELDIQSLPKDLQVDALSFAYCFNNLLEELNVKDDCFTIGQFSKLIASQLDSLPATKNRRKVATTKISVLFVDRTLDLVGPTSHGIDTLMDRVMNMLPKLPNHFTDIAVDMHPLCSAPKLSDTELIAPGCLAPYLDDAEGCTILNSLITKKTKESLMEINRHLVEAITKKKLTSSLPLKAGRLNPETLENHLNLFKHKIEPISQHFGLLQQTLAVVQTLKHSNNSHMDQLYFIEKGLLHSLEDEIIGASALTQIIQLIETRKDRFITLNDILILLIHVYSLVGENFLHLNDQIELLKSTLENAIVEDIDDLPDDLKKFFEDTEGDIYIGKLFQKLQDIGRCRQEFKKYRLIFQPGGRSQPACYLPLFKQIMDDIFNPERPELHDIENKSTGIKDMLKTGIGLFLNVAKPHPADNPTLLIYVIGGITTSEARLIKETITTRQPNLNVLIGSTHVCKPEDILHHLLVPDSYPEMDE